MKPMYKVSIHYSETNLKIWFFLWTVSLQIIFRDESLAAWCYVDPDHECPDARRDPGSGNLWSFKV